MRPPQMTAATTTLNHPPTNQPEASWMPAIRFLPQLLVAVLTLLITAPPLAHAHFTHFEPRIIHITDAPTAGTDTANKAVSVLMRMPLPLLLLSKEWRGLDSGQPLPLTTKTETDKGWQYFLDQDRIKQNPQALHDLIRQGYSFTFNDQPASDISVARLKIFTPHKREPFSTVAYARASLGDQALTIQPGPIEIFDAIVDVELIIKNHTTADAVSVASPLGEHLKVISRLANIVHIYRGEETEKQITIGVLDISFSELPALLSQALNQMKSGIWHIIIGLDHVLFVILIVIAAGSWGGVLRNATGFTIGHSVTLTLGVLGHIPESPLFIPAIEFIIALTILYGGLVILLNKPHFFGFSNVMMIGLVHGYGFSFILSDLLKQGGGISFTNLLFFNIGIEIGQLMIYAAMLPLIYLVSNARLPRLAEWRRTAAGLVIAVALFWIIDRGTTMLAIV